MLIVACVLVVTGVAAAVTFNTTPLYESKARLFFSTSDQSTSTAYQGGLFATQRVASYADLVNGRELAQRVIDDLGLDMEAPDLAEKIDATVVPETVILEISVTDPEPRLAQRIAKSASEQLRDFVNELETPPGRRTPRSRAPSSTPRACRSLRSRPSRCATSAWASCSGCCSVSASP